MEKSIDFLAPRFEGERFEAHEIPLDVLKDLVALQDLITASAKWLYLKDHPYRSRVPPGFTQNVTLKLAEVRAGSVIPVIKLTLLGVSSLFPECEDPFRYFERARDALFETVATAEAGSQTEYALPEEMLGHFQRLGRSLRDGEALVFNPNCHERPARLTRDTRRLILLRSKTQELTEQATHRGTVPEMDQEKMTFEFQIAADHRIKVPISPEHQDCVMQAFNGYRSGKLIKICGVARLSRNDKLLGFSEIDSLALLESLDPSARLEEFKDMENGWLDGKGLAPDPAQLDWLDGALQLFYPEGPLPFLYPTPEGGVQAEWSLGQWDISLDIDLPRHQGAWHALHLSTEEEESRALNLDNPSDWNWLQEKVIALENAAA